MERKTGPVEETRKWLSKKRRDTEKDRKCYREYNADRVVC